MQQYDVIIVGSGLGGLASGVLLAKEGYRVCVLEKNKQIGGMLQIFSRDKVIFDTGVHYVGGLAEGQNLYQIFKYLGIMDKINIRRMDMDFFDGIMFKDDPIIYKYAQGYDNFIRVMLSYFPDEEAAIRKFCDTVQSICKQFPLYNLEVGNYAADIEAYQLDTKAFLESLSSNKKLVSVLGGSNLLYAGEADKTPLFVHALIINHYIESAWKFVDGGSQIARYLVKELKARGGKVIKHINIVKLKEEEGRIVYAQSADGERFYADTFISNVHPLKTIEMTETTLLKNAYRSRIKNLKNTVSVFYVNIVLKKDSFAYRDSNYYCFKDDNPWTAMDYTEDTWPRGYALFFVASSKGTQYAEGLTIMSYMRMDDVEQWSATFNTVGHEESRGDAYEIFKTRKAEKLIDSAEARFPDFRAAIKSYSVATPLTARDYIGTDDGSLYGFAKDYREPMRTFISPRTKIPNLLLTGQNINMHGVLGVSISAIITCSQLIGMENLITKIKNA